MSEEMIVENTGVVMNGKSVSPDAFCKTWGELAPHYNKFASDFCIFIEDANGFEKIFK